jgi:hypothetical protein
MKILMMMMMMMMMMSYEMNPGEAGGWGAAPLNQPTWGTLEVPEHSSSSESDEDMSGSDDCGGGGGGGAAGGAFCDVPQVPDTWVHLEDAQNVGTMARYITPRVLDDDSRQSQRKLVEVHSKAAIALLDRLSCTRRVDTAVTELYHASRLALRLLQGALIVDALDAAIDRVDPGEGNLHLTIAPFVAIVDGAGLGITSTKVLFEAPPSSFGGVGVGYSSAYAELKRAWILLEHHMITGSRTERIERTMLSGAWQLKHVIRDIKRIDVDAFFRVPVPRACAESQPNAITKVSVRGFLNQFEDDAIVLLGSVSAASRYSAYPPEFLIV